MTTRERSKGGCWTCKLRKKKCDESQPSCAICISLCIDCHGYGSRPAWADGGSVEKANLEAWRQRVKETTNHKRRIRLRQHRSVTPSSQVNDLPENVQRITPLDFEEGANFTPQSLPLDEVSSTVQQKTASSLIWPFRREDEFTIENSLLTPNTSERSQIETTQPPILPEKEADLLMHYMDYLFPIQFPFYHHSVIKGGRGWLLSLIMQLEPMYHAIISVSTYDRHFTMLAHDYEVRVGALHHDEELPECPRLETQLKVHMLTLSRLGQLLTRMEDLEKSQSELRLARYIELISCMATLISLEALEGKSDSWQVHFNAAAHILPLANEAFQTEQANTLSETHKAAYHFFSSALVWYQFQSCAITGIMINPISIENQISNMSIPLSDFSGCDEWVTQEILKIIKLSQWKETMKSKNQLSNRELTTRALAIDTKLKSEMSASSTRLGHSSPSDFFANPSAYIRLLVTRIFGYSAQIYLYTVESGPCPDIPEIHTNVSLAIDAFKALPQAKLILNLSWPFCIAASMANVDQQQAFLQISAKVKIKHCQFGSSKHVLAIVEECWRMRENGEGNVDWRVAMRNLGLNILLV